MNKYLLCLPEKRRVLRVTSPLSQGFKSPQSTILQHNLFITTEINIEKITANYLKKAARYN